MAVKAPGLETFTTIANSFLHFRLECVASLGEEKSSKEGWNFFKQWQN